MGKNFKAVFGHEESVFPLCTGHEVARDDFPTEGVIGIDEFRTRLFGSKIYVDVEIVMEPYITLIEAHNTAENVHDAIEREFPAVKHCMVHVKPASEAQGTEQQH